MVEFDNNLMNHITLHVKSWFVNHGHVFKSPLKVSIRDRVVTLYLIYTNHSVNNVANE